MLLSHLEWYAAETDIVLTQWERYNELCDIVHIIWLTLPEKYNASTAHVVST